jgi:alpha-L-fucosidase
MASARDIGPYGDFETPEQGIPEAGLRDQYSQPIPWEACLTLNNNWGYHATDHEWKTPQMVVHTLVDCVSKNGNLLLNVGPDGRGRIPDASAAILEEVGRWMRKNGESVYGCGGAAVPRPEWGRFTQRGSTVYAHWMHPHVGHIDVGQVRGRMNDVGQPCGCMSGVGQQSGRIGEVVLLHDGSEAKTAKTWWGNQEAGHLFLNVDEPTYRTFALPDPIDTVFRIELE